jgi:hypothetical protein
MATVPSSTPVQFGPPMTGTFYLDTFVDVSGSPVNVIDIDLGADLTGRVTLPGTLTGTGIVRLVANEIGGSFNGTVKETTIALTGANSPNDPSQVEYPWSLHLQVPDLPDESKAYHFALTFVVTNPGPAHTDIAAIFDLGDYMVV